MRALRPTLFAIASLMLVLLPLKLEAQTVEVSNVETIFRINQQSSQYSFQFQGTETVREDAVAGVLLDGNPVHFHLLRRTASSLDLQGESASGKHMRLTVALMPNRAELVAQPEESG